MEGNNLTLSFDPPTVLVADDDKVFSPALSDWKDWLTLARQHYCLKHNSSISHNAQH